MSYHTQSSFSAGELDPALHERTTFDKYQSGLKTLRNGIIGKTGRMINRGGQKFKIKTKLQGKKVAYYSPPYSKYMLEFGDQYVRIHDTVLGTFADATIGTLVTPFPNDITEAKLPYLKFSSIGTVVYVFCDGVYLMYIDVPNAVIYTDAVNSIFMPNAPGTGGSAVYTGAGYPVQYAATVVVNGQESEPWNVSNNWPGALLPVLAAQKNTIIGQTIYNNATEARLYRAPAGGIGYGYIGSFPVAFTGGAWKFTAEDVGIDADYTQAPPQAITGFTRPSAGIINGKPIAGAFYQQRLIIADPERPGVLYASQPESSNFSRKFPLSADSALAMKIGTEGTAKILDIVVNDGMIVFTTAGVFVHEGVLVPENISLNQKGSYVIDETLSALKVPGALLFVDRETNAVRTLIFSNEAGGFDGDDINVFSSHLFTNKKIVSWAYQSGDVPIIWCVMSDGVLLSLTYMREQKMRAWSRHDSQGGTYENVVVVKSAGSVNSKVYFTVKRGNDRFIEEGVPRFQTDLKDHCLMDAAVSFKTDLAASGTSINVFAEDPTDWEGVLTIAASSAIFANTAGNGQVGSVFKYFDKDGSSVELTVIQYLSTTQIRVTPDVEFPFDQGTNIHLYKTFTTLTGLTHLNGFKVSLFVDGYVLASPNNDQEEYPELLVAGGTLTIPDGKRGAICHVGLPITSDFETLDVDTSEQKPTLIASKVTTAIYMKILNTRGLFVGAEFLDNNSVENMEDVEEREETEDITIGNAAQAPRSKRLELTCQNDWDSQGRICVRQVDPLPLEILSIIPDLYVGGQ